MQPRLVFRHLLEELARSGKAVLYCSHELDAVERTCSACSCCITAGGRARHGARLRGTLSKGSLEAVFQQLVCEIDPRARRATWWNP